MQSNTEEIKTLLIDDEVEILEILSDILMDLPIKIYQASNGEDALKEFFEKNPEVVITDINLPDINGIDIINKIREKNGYLETYIIALSGMSFQNVRINSIKAGANEFIGKPFSVSELIFKFENILRIISGVKLLKNENVKLEEYSLIDKYTGFYNSRYLDKRYIEEMSKAYRYKRNISAIRMEFSNLSKVKLLTISDKNEYLISKVAAATKDTMRKCDIVMRTSDNELTLLLPETDAEQARTAAEKLQNILENMLKTENDNGMKVAINIGIASNSNQRNELNGMMNSLDEAYEKAKEIGNGSIIIAC